MSNLRDIKRRIKSVRNTSQITKAMQMVASAKMRRAQEQALRGRVFISALASVFRHLRDSITEGGRKLRRGSRGVEQLLCCDGWVMLELQSGTYSFVRR